MRTRASRRPPHERRKLILDGAERVFAAAGYGGADTTALARAGGVSAPALYRYFPTKKDLFLEILKLSGERLAEIWTRIIEEAADPLEAMERISLAYSEHSGSRPSVMRIWFHALSDTDAPEVREALRSNMTTLAGLLEGNLREAQKAGLIDGDVDPQRRGVGLHGDRVHVRDLAAGRDGRRARPGVVPRLDPAPLQDDRRSAQG